MQVAGNEGCFLMPWSYAPSDIRNIPRQNVINYLLWRFPKSRIATITFAMSVCRSAWNSSALSGRILMKFGIPVRFENKSRKLEFEWNLTKIKGTFLKKNLLLLSLLLLFTAIGLSPGGSGYFTCIQNIKLVINKFKSGGLHEKHVVATWNVGNRLSICF